MSEQDLLADLRALCEETLLHADVDADDFLSDPLRQRAVERTLELIGEVAGRLEGSELDLPWRAMKDTRNLLAHAYHRVDAMTVWKTARERVPEILAQLEFADQLK